MIAIPAIYPVTAHTRHVGPGSTFVAIHGFKENGIDFIPEALRCGASTIVVENEAVIPDIIRESIFSYRAEVVRVENTRKALAELSAAAADYPARKLTIVGFTGTKGKTTSVYLLEHIFRMNGFKVARITGITNMIDGQELPANLTTPQPDYLHQFFKVCVDYGVTHVVMEVAAQALSLYRMETIGLDVAIFTNLGREHFEMYANMEEYCAVKARIFDYTTEMALRLCHASDRFTASLINDAHAIYGYGFSGQHRSYVGLNPVSYPAVAFDYADMHIVCPSLIGLYNAENLLAVVLCAERYGLSGEHINKALASFGIVPGRIERYSLRGNITAIIDYAHNPSSYSALLSTLRPLTDHLIVVFGASGTRDKGKRPLMGAVAAEYADVIVLTSDNPGPEDPLLIMQCIKDGISPTSDVQIVEEPDRAIAISKAYELATPGSIIALLGKGPDEYQVVHGIKTVFSERALLQEFKGVE
jgi:UDP-N-acetylmuramoyl-L-alanyl-D-glutamate--2,6-diaminopimelate ligase